MGFLEKQDQWEPREVPAHTALGMRGRIPLSAGWRPHGAEFEGLGAKAGRSPLSAAVGRKPASLPHWAGPVLSQSTSSDSSHQETPHRHTRNSIHPTGRPTAQSSWPVPLPSPQCGSGAPFRWYRSSTPNLKFQIPSLLRATVMPQGESSVPQSFASCPEFLQMSYKIPFRRFYMVYMKQHE